jgi:hypothetical protein
MGNQLFLVSALILHAKKNWIGVDTATYRRDYL